MAENTPQRPRSLIATVGGVILVALAAWAGVDIATDNATDTAAEPGIPACDLSSLPPEAAHTADAIESGGPFAYPQHDNQRFGNYEGILPDEDLGFYREYTVDTPGLHHRGERRIVTGGGTVTDPEVWYYTEDHYDSFCEIPHEF